MSAHSGRHLLTLAHRQLGPNVGPGFGAQIAARHLSARLAFDGRGQCGRALSRAVHHITDVPERRAAALCEGGSRLFIWQGLDEGFQVHMEPDYTKRCNPCQHRSVFERPSNATMAADKLIRVENLKALCEERSLTAKDLERLVGGRDTYWHGMLAGTRSFGEKAARKIEEKLTLPRGWLDQSHAKGEQVDALDADTLAFAKVYQSMSLEERGRLKLLYYVALPGKHPDKIKGAITGKDSPAPAADFFLGGLDSGLGQLDEGITKKARK